MAVFFVAAMGHGGIPSPLKKFTTEIAENRTKPVQVAAEKSVRN
jgi:hypothetical protein